MIQSQMEKIDGTNYSVEGGIALVGANNGPVNSLGYPLRCGLKKSFEKAVADPNVRAIVFYGEGRTFPAGADISEFKTGKVNQLPLTGIYDAIEDSPKPCVAAVHGTALGGGAELTLSCHYRIAADKSKFGFPEVQLGLLPGAGGTQRAPRVVGPLVALEMISTGAPINAWKAEQVGLVDHVVEIPKGQHTLNFLKQQAVYYAQSIAGKPFESRRVRHQPCEPLDDFYFDNALQMSAKAARGHVAPAMCIECVRAATKLPINEGFAFERKGFFKLAMTPESRALQHVFFAQRAVTKIPGVPKSLAKIPKKVGIIGAGTMGAGIAMCFAQKGIEVVLKDIKKEYCDRGMKIILKNWQRSARKGKWTAFQVKKMMSLVKPSLDYADLADVDMVIEAVFENMDLKKKIFRSLDEVCKPGCVLASNTSTLDVDEIANATSRPESVIGMHFFSPANVMKLLENVKGSKTSKEVIATATEVGKLIGKIPVLVGNGFGFVGNRCIFPYSSEAEGMVLEGASPYDVDKTVYKFGMPMGPFQMGDLSGNDVGAKIRKEQFKISGKPEHYVNQISDALVEQGLLGQKTKQGWYDYKKSRRGKPSPQTLEIVSKVRAQQGISPKQFATKEMEEKCFYALICEGFRCLEDGVAARPLDIDAIMMFGYGFPVTKGGPMFYADRVGLKKILRKVKEFHAAEPKNRNWTVPALLQKCVDQNVGVYKYYGKLAKRQAKL